jgi:hypothetical protein
MTTKLEYRTCGHCGKNITVSALLGARISAIAQTFGAHLACADCTQTCDGCRAVEAYRVADEHAPV